MKTYTIQIADDEVLVALKRGEDYDDVHPELVSEDAIGDRWPEYRTIHGADLAEPAAQQAPQVLALAHRIAWRYKKSSDPHHSDTYTFNEATLLQFAAALAQYPKAGDEWEPIETAPMDGTEFWAYRERDGKMATAHRVPRDDCEMWCFGGTTAAVEIAPWIKPSHWRALPPEPGPIPSHAGHGEGGG